LRRYSSTVIVGGSPRTLTTRPFEHETHVTDALTCLRFYSWFVTHVLEFPGKNKNIFFSGRKIGRFLTATVRRIAPGERAAARDSCHRPWRCRLHDHVIEEWGSGRTLPCAEVFGHLKGQRVAAGRIVLLSSRGWSQRPCCSCVFSVIAVRGPAIRAARCAGRGGTPAEVSSTCVVSLPMEIRARHTAGLQLTQRIYCVQRCSNCARNRGNALRPPRAGHGMA